MNWMLEGTLKVRPIFRALAGTSNRGQPLCGRSWPLSVAQHRLEYVRLPILVESVDEIPPRGSVVFTAHIRY